MTKKQPKFAEFYKKFRSGRAFFLVLSVFIAVWLLLHKLINLDPDYGILNLLLSIEASVSMSLFMMLSERQDELQRQQDANVDIILRTILDVAQATRDLLKESQRGAEHES